MSKRLDPATVAMKATSSALELQRTGGTMPDILEAICVLRDCTSVIDGLREELNECRAMVSNIGTLIRDHQTLEYKRQAE